MKLLTKSLSIASFPLMIGSVPAQAQLIDVNVDLLNLIDVGLCIGSTCPDDNSSTSDDLTLSDTDVSMLFLDTSEDGTPSNDWRIDINDDTVGGENYFGIADVTTGSLPVKIMAGVPDNGMVMDGSGKLGLGTQFPMRKLHVAATNSPAMRLEQTDAGLGSQIWDVVGNETNFFVLDVNRDNIAFEIKAGAPDAAQVIAANGFVGYGTAAPEQQLHIQSNADSTDAFALFDAQGANSDAAFLLRQNGAIPTTWEFRNQQGSGRLNVGIRGGNTPFKIDDMANNNLMRLGTNGNPDMVEIEGRLVVNQTEVQVPDYVFKSDYDLRPLAEVESFIKANSHLPDVPSEAEIEAEGLDMITMQYALLRKVEELTLYTLQQEKRALQQEETIAMLMDKLDATAE